jgi:hypothetical protein
MHASQLVLLLMMKGEALRQVQPPRHRLTTADVDAAGRHTLGYQFHVCGLASPNKQ